MLEVCWTDTWSCRIRQTPLIRRKCPVQRTHNGGVTASLSALDVIDAMNEGQIVVCRDVPLAYLVSDGASICREASFPGLAFTVSSGISQRRTNIE